MELEGPCVEPTEQLWWSSSPHLERLRSDQAESHHVVIQPRESPWHFHRDRGDQTQGLISQALDWAVSPVDTRTGKIAVSLDDCGLFLWDAELCVRSCSLSLTYSLRYIKCKENSVTNNRNHHFN